MLLFLDFDGVIHGVGDERFVHRPILEAILREHPHVEVVFSTSWREQFDLVRLRKFFSVDLQPRFIGTLPFVRQRTPPYITTVRYQEILLWLESHAEHQRRQWIALDDDVLLFPHACPELILCDPRYGLGEPSVIDKLKTAIQRHSA